MQSPAASPDVFMHTVFRGAQITLCAVLLLVFAGHAARAQTPNHAVAEDPKFQGRSGEAIYQGICQGCHMPQAQGAVGAGAYPALAGNPRLASKIYPAFIVINGSKAMPSFATFLDDEQIAAVGNYVRSHFGNQYTNQLTPTEVKALRPKHRAASQ
jgi:mono/diheme cytochrome c family protein